MATAADIAIQGSGYTGNAGLGGGVVEAVKLDTRPLDMLTQYTFLYNQAESQRKQKEKEATAAELSSITAYNLPTAIPKDREIVLKKLEELREWTRQNASKVNSTDDPNTWLEFRNKKNDFENLLAQAKKRDVSYKARIEEASNETNPLLAAKRRKDLDDEANSTDISMDIKPSQEYDLAPIEIKPAGTFTIDVLRGTDNQIITRGYTIPSYKNASAQATAIIGGLIDAFPKEGTPEWNKLNESQKSSIKEQREYQFASGKIMPIKKAEALNDALNKKDPTTGKRVYFDDNGNFDMQAFNKGESGNHLLTSLMEQVTKYNAEANRLRNLVASGAFEDKTGRKITFGYGIDEADYQPIDVTKGSITPEELLKMEIIGKTQEISYKTSITQTNEGINKDKNAIDREQLAETTRHNKAMEGLQGEELNAKIAQWKSSGGSGGGATEVAQNNAMAKAKRIYQSLVDLSSNGIITPNKIRQLNTEQLRYLGSLQVIKTPTSGEKTEYLPLGLDGDKEFVIQLEGGEIKVMKPKGSDTKLGRAGNGKFTGQWDNTKSTNLFNIATNILNEEVKTSSGKAEFGAFNSLDSYGTSSQGQSTTTAPYPLPSGKARTVQQGGYTYTWNEQTGQYE